MTSWNHNVPQPDLPNWCQDFGQSERRDYSSHDGQINDEYIPYRARATTGPARTLCRGRCFYSNDTLGVEPVEHDQYLNAGFSWYLCPAHRQYHAICARPDESTILQPLCGECAVLFYAGCEWASWLQELDRPMFMSNYHEIILNAGGTASALFREVGTTGSPEEQRHIRDALADVGGDFDVFDRDRGIPLPRDLMYNVLEEIPRWDSTWASLSETLIPHGYIQDLYLLEFGTFLGPKAYQPCTKHPDVLTLFDWLTPFENNCDPVFGRARICSCIAQATEDLPKELRWVMATIYNFCCEMLRPRSEPMTTSETSVMKVWLSHWILIAKILYLVYDMDAPVPEFEWRHLHRGSSNAGWDDSSSVANHERDRDEATAGPAISSQPSSSRTVIRRPARLDRSFYIDRHQHIIPLRNRTDAVRAWLDSGLGSTRHWATGSMSSDDQDRWPAARSPTIETRRWARVRFRSDSDGYSSECLDEWCPPEYHAT
ncbi:hypothetical protein HIM_04725 [Hirsutella minnesotensis 3608]|uniref:Uncharacterized protein n=1 Tax=Hirsutella minnesotensis 3608 TaxID=1043627 RepID=A0A0F7ZL22_9HYPO|nr:hypothetical protein HIM_04725 [Hirsutella minnesotensis 3608]